MVHAWDESKEYTDEDDDDVEEYQRFKRDDDDSDEYEEYDGIPAPSKRKSAFASFFSRPLANYAYRLGSSVELRLFYCLCTESPKQSPLATTVARNTKLRNSNRIDEPNAVANDPF